MHYNFNIEKIKNDLSHNLNNIFKIIKKTFKFKNDI